MDASSPLTLSAIVAMAENRVIGKDNQLPWHLPADLKHFKEITTGHFIIMGRKTFESIGKSLPHRTNIVLSRDKHYRATDCITLTTLEEALEQARQAHQHEVFIIGGAEIYRQLLPQITRLYLTIVHHSFDGDALFPHLTPEEWQEVSREKHEKDEKNPHAFSFITLERKSGYRSKNTL